MVCVYAPQLQTKRRSSKIQAKLLAQLAVCAENISFKIWKAGLKSAPQLCAQNRLNIQITLYDLGLMVLTKCFKFGFVSAQQASRFLSHVTIFWNWASRVNGHRFQDSEIKKFRSPGRGASSGLSSPGDIFRGSGMLPDRRQGSLGVTESSSRCTRAKRFE